MAPYSGAAMAVSIVTERLIYSSQLGWFSAIGSRHISSMHATSSGPRAALRPRFNAPRSARGVRGLSLQPDGTLDWGYFQINTVHLERPGLNLRDLLDCKANIDFAYQLYTERVAEPVDHL